MNKFELGDKVTYADAPTDIGYGSVIRVRENSFTVLWPEGSEVTYTGELQFRKVVQK